jgi:hypothetical protein
VHHKLYLENPRPPVERFEVTHGYNLATAGVRAPAGGTRCASAWAWSSPTRRGASAGATWGRAAAGSAAATTWPGRRRSSPSGGATRSVRAPRRRSPRPSSSSPRRPPACRWRRRERVRAQRGAARARRARAAPAVVSDPRPVPARPRQAPPDGAGPRPAQRRVASDTTRLATRPKPTVRPSQRVSSSSIEMGTAVRRTGGAPGAARGTPNAGQGAVHPPAAPRRRGNPLPCNNLRPGRRPGRGGRCRAAETPGVAGGRRARPPGAPPTGRGRPPAAPARRGPRRRTTRSRRVRGRRPRACARARPPRPGGGA